MRKFDTEKEIRYRKFLSLLAAGHVRVMNDCNPERITFWCGKMKFTFRRTSFPTPAALATLNLLIASGASLETPPQNEEDRIDSVTMAVTAIHSRVRV